MIGQHDDLLRTHRDGGLEVGGLGFGTNDQNDPAAPRQRAVRAASGGGHIEQYRRGAGPHVAAGRLGRVDNRQADGRRDAVDIVAECGVADQRQDPVACGHDLSLQPELRHVAAVAVWHLWMNANLGTKQTNHAVCPH